jgi:hypothetical protein
LRVDRCIPPAGRSRRRRFACPRVARSISWRLAASGETRGLIILFSLSRSARGWTDAIFNSSNELKAARRHTYVSLSRIIEIRALLLLTTIYSQLHVRRMIVELTINFPPSFEHRRHPSIGQLLDPSLQFEPAASCMHAFRLLFKAHAWEKNE